MNLMVLKDVLSLSKYIVLKKANRGFCPICEKKTIFFEEKDWLRDHYKCFFCKSIPRNRAIIHILEMHFPKWREMKIHESSPGGVSSDKIARECKHYTPTQFWQDTPPGSSKNGIRCENLERMTFKDNSFDLMITQDVMEHVFNPDKAFNEISRTLKPGGAHVFTVPIYVREKTLIRAVESEEGIQYLAPKDFHGNPIDNSGSLVTREWGNDLVDFIYENSKMTSTVYHIENRRLGLDGKFLEVVVSRKRAD